MLEILSRVQFALTVLYHFIYVPLTIGLILMICIFETMHYKKKNDTYRKISDFFGNIFIVNYAIGIVTGITMSIQFGTNWGAYSEYMGSVFGAPLALEALIAFFLESTFTGIYIFRRAKLTPKFRLVTVWLIFIGTNISALWIITANGFMQNPVGYEVLDNQRLAIVNFMEIILNPYAWYMLAHNNLSAFVLGGFVVLSVSCYKLLKDNITDEEREIFSKITKISAIVVLVSTLITMSVGSNYASFISEVQPTKYEMISGNIVDEVSPIISKIVNIAFLVMVSLGMFFLVTSLYVIFYNDKFLKADTLKKVFKYTFVLPYIAIFAGWIVAEMGRQPYVVYGLLYTSDGVSQNVSVASVWFSLLTTTALYILVLFFVIHFLIIQIRQSIDHNKYYLAYKGEEENES